MVKLFHLYRIKMLYNIVTSFQLVEIHNERYEQKSEK